MSKHVVHLLRKRTDKLASDYGAAYGSLRASCSCGWSTKVEFDDDKYIAYDKLDAAILAHERIAL